MSRPDWRVEGRGWPLAEHSRFVSAGGIDWHVQVMGNGPVALLLHIIGYLACLREPRIFDLWLTKVSRCPRISNWRRWRCNSYGT